MISFKIAWLFTLKRTLQVSLAQMQLWMNLSLWRAA